MSYLNVQKGNILFLKLLLILFVCLKLTTNGQKHLIFFMWNKAYCINLYLKWAWRKVYTFWNII